MLWTIGHRPDLTVMDLDNAFEWVERLALAFAGLYKTSNTSAD